SNDTTEGTVGPASLTFSNLNWNTPQTVTVTGQNDAVQDGNIAYSIVFSASASTDTNYNGTPSPNVAVTNNDNDVSGYTVSAISGNTTEGGGTGTFTVVLTSEPTANVTVNYTSNDLTEGTVGPASLTFTNLNWNLPQTVTVTGQNDAVQDGNVAYSIVFSASTSADANYNSTTPSPNVAVTNNDNDVSGYTVSAISGNTTEAGGTATFTVVLTSEPTANVTVNYTSNDSTEGTVGPASLTFTNLNWNTPQTVTVTGQNDAIVDGNIAFSIVFSASTSTDTNYNGTPSPNVAVTNNDNDVAGYTVSAISGNTTEAGVTASFTVVLTSEPTANVTVNYNSNDLTEGTVAPASLTFTNLNWNTPQTVTVTGQDDATDDGDVAYSIAFSASSSADANYNATTPTPNVSVTNVNDDPSQLAITVQPSNATAGAAISPSIQVELRDSLGTLMNTATNTVTFAIGTNPGGGTLSGTANMAAAAGVATFSTLSIDKVGTGYDLSATSAGLTGTTTAAFNISPAPATQVVETTVGSDFNAGGSTSLTVQVQDGFGNLVTSDNATQITFSPTLSGTVSGVTTGTGDASYGVAGGAETVTVAGGVASITITDTVAETFQIAFTNNAALSNPANDGTLVSPAAATVLALTGPTSLNANCSSAYTITTKDAYANVSNVTGNTIVNLTGGGSGTFYSDAGCASPVTSVTVSTGTSTQSFYLQDSAAESLTLTTSATSFSNGTLGVTVDGVPPSVTVEQNGG
ncbi:hypothetical protein HYS28_03350, partial [Candidatus Uhrbacteria bacterium]|nr:hypothetical protein [Candidatus Uhrbacteria bacterium]